MSTQPKTFLTPEQYLAIEREAPYKSEYFNGEMFAMSGVRKGHDLIAGNVHGALWTNFRSRSCVVHSSDMRVRTAAKHFCYPDTSAVCGEPQYLDEEVDALLNPNLIVEVLSPSTEAFDRGRKFELYQSIPSFTEYLLLASDRIHGDLFVRQASGLWLLRSFGELEDVLTLESVGCRLKLADLYEKVAFDAA
jgi:Uma2 family endonuclease